MSRKPDHLEALETAIFLNHRCRPTHRETAFVHVKTKDAETVWKGHVEVFDLAGHQAAHTCYAWQNIESGGKIFAILGNNFIDSAQKAVQAAIFVDEERPTPPK